NVAVGIGRSVMQHELGRALPLRANLPVEIERRPARERVGLRDQQVGLHRKARARQIDRIYPHKSKGSRLNRREAATPATQRRAIHRFNNEPMVRAATLDSGLKVLIQEEHTAPLVSVWCWYKVGSKHEAPGLTGVSHWVEHMNFKGTANIPR